MKKHIVSVSGGADSAACYLLALETGEPFEAIFADTGNEHPYTLDYVMELPIKTGGPPVRILKANFTVPIQIRRYGLEQMLETGEYIRNWTESMVLRVLENLNYTGVPMLDLCMMKGRFPSTRARFCTTSLKMEQINKYAIGPAIHETITKGGQVRDVISWVGVRRDESRARQDVAQWETGNMGNRIYRPLADWRKENCFALIKKHGLRANPLYYKGCTRVGCMPCIHARKSEILEISKRFPEHIDKIREWERLVSLCSKRGFSSFFSADKTPGEGDFHCDIDSVVLWSKTTHGGKQFDMRSDWPVEACASAYGLCE